MRATGSSSISIRKRIFPTASTITSADVLFTFDLLKTKGLPSQRAAYALVRSVEAPDD